MRQKIDAAALSAATVTLNGASGALIWRIKRIIIAVRSK
jgi:hypothetical protein